MGVTIGVVGMSRLVGNVGRSVDCISGMATRFSLTLLKIN